MIRQLKTSAPYLCLAALVLCAIGLRLIPDSDTALERLLSDDSFYSNDLRIETDAAMRFLINDAGDKTAWCINCGPQRGRLRVMLLSGRKIRTRPAYSEFSQMIAWIAEYQVIVIDVDYLMELATRLDNLGEAAPDENPYARRELETETYKAFLIWVLGHELGHAELNHRTSHFRSNAFEGPALSGSANQMLEVQADAFAARRISLSAEQTTAVSNMLFRILNAELNARTPENHIPGPLINLFSNDAVDVLASGSHPEFLVRAARILSQIEYPPGTDQRLGVWSGMFLGRIRDATGTPCLVSVRSDSISGSISADLMVAQKGRRLAVYWLPAKLLLYPGQYDFNVAAPGYETRQEQINFADCQHVPDLNLRMTKDRAIPSPR